MTDRRTIRSIPNNAQQCFANSVVQLIFSSTRLLEIIDGNNNNTLIKKILNAYKKNDATLSKVIGDAARDFIKSEAGTFKVHNPNEETKHPEKINKPPKNVEQIRRSQMTNQYLKKEIYRLLDNDDLDDDNLEEAIRLSEELEEDDDLDRALKESMRDTYHPSSNERGLGKQDEATPFLRYLLSYYCESIPHMQYVTRDVTAIADTTAIVKDIQIPYTHKYDKNNQHREDYKAQMEEISFKFTTRPLDYNGDKTTNIIEPSCVYVFTSNIGMNYAPHYLDIKVLFNGSVKYLQYIFRGGIVYTGFSNVGSSGVNGKSGGHYYTTKVTENGYYILNDTHTTRVDTVIHKDRHGVFHYKPNNNGDKFICVLYECVKTFGIKEYLVGQRLNKKT